jgi:hypothetical protein
VIRQREEVIGMIMETKVLAESIKASYISPAFLKTLLRRGGVPAVRDVLSAFKRASAKHLHPDKIGGKSDAAYARFQAAISTLESARELDLSRAIEDYKAKEANKEYGIEYNFGSLLTEFAPMASHTPAAKNLDILIYTLNFKEDETNYILRATDSGVLYRASNESCWHEEAIFLIGTFDRKIDNLLLKPLENYKKRWDAPLPGKVVESSPIRRMVIPKYLYRVAEQYFSFQIAEKDHRGLAAVDKRGVMYHLGYIKSTENLRP